MFLLAIGGILIFDLTPSQLLPSELKKLFFKFPPIDTIGHFISFFLLTWLVNSLLKIPRALTIITLILYAVLTEVGQSYLVFRSAEFTDSLADIIGISSFFIIKAVYDQCVKIRNSSPNHS
jgi:VanZ family protein